MQREHLYSPNHMAEDDKSSLVFEPFLRDYELDGFDVLNFPEFQTQDIEESTLARETTTSIHERHVSRSNSTSFYLGESEIKYPMEDTNRPATWRNDNLERWIRYDCDMFTFDVMQRSPLTSPLPTTMDKNRDKQTESSTKTDEESWDSMETKTTPEKTKNRQEYLEETQNSQDYLSGHLATTQSLQNETSESEKHPRSERYFYDRRRPTPLITGSRMNCQEDKPPGSVEQGTLRLSSKENFSYPWIFSPASARTRLSRESPVRISPTTLPSVTPRDDIEANCTMSMEGSHPMEGCCPSCGNMLGPLDHDERLKKLEEEYNALFCQVSNLQATLLSLLKDPRSHDRNKERE